MLWRGQNPAAGPPRSLSFYLSDLFGRWPFPLCHDRPIAQSSVISDILCRDGLGDVFSRVGADVGAKLVWLDGW